MRQNTRARNLPLLNNIRIASPCSESWDGMVGDDRVRFCGGCEKNVYNLSAMTEAEAQALITEQEGDMCVRLYKRKDGTVITADCPVGVRRKQVTKVAAAAFALGASGMALAAADAAQPRDYDTTSHHVRYQRARQDNGPSLLDRLLGNEPEPEPEVLMGDISEPPRPLMGAIAPPPPPPPKPEKDEVPVL